jgi:cytochrome P450
MTAPAEVDVDPFSDGFLTDPFPYLERVRQAGRVVFLPAYGVFATASHEQVHAVLRDHEHFSSAAGAGLANIARETAWRKPSILLEVDPPVHTRNRAVVAGVMSPKALRSLQDVFDEQASRLADELVARASFDAVRDLGEVFPTVVFPKAFGVEADTREPLLAYGAMVFNGHGPRNRLFQEAMAGAEGVLEWIASQCERSALRPGSIGAAVYEAADAAGVSEAEAGLLIRSFLSAGIDTTVSAIAYAVYHFASGPDQWQLVRDDPSLARNAFEEVVRPPRLRHRGARLRRHGDRPHGGRGTAACARLAGCPLRPRRPGRAAAEQHAPLPRRAAGHGHARLVRVRRPLRRSPG